MKKYIYSIRLFVTFLLLTNFSQAQLTVTNSLTPQQLAQLISGPGVQILNPVVHSGTNGYGKYNATSSNLNITEGLLLTTGVINNAVGPNNVSNKTTFFGNQNSPDTYPLLTNYTGRTIYEYCEFEFDIIPQGDTIKFDFVFASEEYEEWVGSQYNDVFAFFISGPGITPDAGAGAYHNIALLPNSTTAVTINNVNQNSNTAYYQTNTNGSSVQYDGFTKGLKAISRVNPCATYHLKLIVADASDKLWDSGVFIEKISSNNVFLLSQTAGGIPNMVEGCNAGTVIFTRPNVTASPLTVNYWLGGTAINGTDYPLVGSSPSPSNPKTITIPANQPSAFLNINSFADGINEGTEYLTVYLGNPMCSNIIMDSLRFYIQDSLFTTVVPPSDSLCSGQSRQITTTGGGSAFNWLPAAGLNNAAIANPIATPSVTTTYTLTTTASNCVMQKTSKLNVSNMALTFSNTPVSCNGTTNGAVGLSISSGFGPYLYSWTGPSSFAASTQNISGLNPGTYSVTVTDSKGCSKTGTTTITQPTPISATITSPTVNGGFNIACNGGATGSASVSASGGTGAYTYSWSTSPVQTTATASGLTAGTYSVTIRDANNCPVIKTITLTQPAQLTSTISSQTNVSCFGTTNGSATVSPSGGNGAYTYSWSTVPAQSTATATNLGAGSYSVIVRDANNCSVTNTITISQPASAITASVSSQTNVLCFGNTTGSATVSASGGAGSYTYSWNTTPAQTSATAINLSAGSYVVTVRDVNNCTVTVPVSITQPATNLSAVISSQSNVSCSGGGNASATVSASGGTPGYTYSWNTTPVQTSATAVNLSAGTYNVIVRDANNCSYSIQVNITQPATTVTATITAQTNALCFGGSSGSATVAGSGGSAPYTYSWNTSPVQTSATAVNLAAGAYTVTVRDFNNCSATKTVTITQPAAPVGATISSQSNVLCNGSATGSATVNATGGSAGYTYSWNSNPVQTTATATGLAAGNYTVTVKDINNCSTVASVSITQPSSVLNASITQTTNVLCKTASTGSATVVASGGSGSYSYSWNTSPVQTTSTASGLVAGNYTVTVSDNNGCTTVVTRTVTITEPALVLNASSSSILYNGNNISCFGGNNGIINLSPVGGVGPYVYSWSGPGGFSSSAEDINSLIAGTYSVQVTDANGCTKNHSTVLTQPAALTLNGTMVPATCPAFNDGSINLAVSGGTAVYSYAWSGPAAFTSSSQNISGLAQGNYSVAVTDANACVQNNVYTVTQPGAIVITYRTSSYIGGTNISCSGYNDGNINSVNVTGGTPVYNYSWTGPGFFTATTPNISSLYAGTYQLVVTDQAGCIANKIISLTQPSQIIASLTASSFGESNVSCNGSSDGSITSTVAGGTPAYSFLWTGPSTYTSTSQNISSLAGGTYTLAVTDVNSCVGTNTITLSQPTSLTAAVNSPSVAGGYNVSCAGGNDGSANVLAIGGTPGYSYLWTGPSGFTSTLPNPTGLAAGTYTIVVTDSNGCTAMNTLTLVEPGVLVVTATSSTMAGGYNVSCNGQTDGSINLNVTGGSLTYTYVWTGSNAFTSSQQNLTGIGAGSYTVLVTDSNRCTATTSITLTQPDPFSLTLTSPTVNGGYNISCNGSATGSINVSAIGGNPNYTFVWSGPSGYTSTLQNIGSLEAGAYSVIANDTNGCVATGNITLTAPEALTLSLSSPTYAGGFNVSCDGSVNGTINSSVSGGTPGYSYSWSGPSGFTSTAQNPSGLGAGEYIVNVSDINGCVISDSITLTQPSTISGSITATSNISCNGGTDGNIIQVINGGTMPYTIIWSNGATTQNLLNVGAGNYSVIVTDANNCSFTQSITLTEPPPLFASAVSTSYVGGYNIPCSGSGTGDIILGVIGGTAPYTFNWTGPNSFTSTSQNLSNLSAGTYMATITDSNGCTTTASVTLTEPDTLSLLAVSASFVGGYNVSCNGAVDGSINVTVTGGTAVFQYSWTGPLGFTSSSPNISSVPAGTYTLVVSDINNCSATATITLLAPDTLSASTISSVYTGGFNVSCFGATNASINTTVTGGSGVYTYQWTGPAGYTSSSQNISGLAAGNYTLVITDANGCSFTSYDTLTQPIDITNSLVPSVYSGGNNISCFNANDGTILLNSTGGSGPYIQVWTGPAGFTSTSNSLSGLSAGTYSVIVTDANSCSKTEVITLQQPTILTSTLTSQVYGGGYNIKCRGDSSGVISATVNGGTPAYQYIWSGPGGFAANTQNLVNVPAGTYYLSVTDINNCSHTDSITLTEIPTAIAGNLSITNLNCYNDSTGAIMASVSGGIAGYTYYWRGPDNYTSASQNISGLDSGFYNLVVTDSNGCQLTIDAMVTEPAALMYNSVGTDPTCFGVNDGSINGSLSGGTSPYTYQWSTGATTEDVSGLASGSHTVIYTDSHGCKDTSIINLGQAPQALTFTKTASELKCFNDTTCSIVTTVSGGTQPYVYTWSNGSSNANLTDLGQGTYIVSVTDARGCTYMDTTIVTQPDSMFLTLSSPTYPGGFNVSPYGMSNGSINLAVNGGTGPYSYAWSNNLTTQNLSNLSAGMYYVTCVDTNGCKAIGSLRLSEPYELDMPTGFSPNGDGKNDFFVVRGLEVYPENNITIYNRWGNVVYSKGAYSNDWDGISNNGESLPDAAYFVIVEINDKKIVLKGYVELRR